MISDDERQRIQTETLAKADALNDADLRREAARVFVAAENAPAGDERERLKTADRILTNEMVNRGLTPSF